MCIRDSACIAIAGYLEVPKDSGNLLIENPLRPYKCSEPIGKDYSYWGPIEVETNDVLFFPGWLTHKTESNSTDNPRYVLSTNVSVLTNWPGIPSWHYEGRKSYERENPGSDLKAPSKKVGNPRRASFCARMKGMKKKLTSKKTANDKDSRINKSLRAWNC